VSSVEGLLLSRSESEVRLILSHSALVLDATQVISIEALGRLSSAGGMEVVRVNYRERDPDTSSPAGEGNSHHEGRLPFAMLVRADPAQVPASPRYRELERRFLEHHGLNGPR